MVAADSARDCYVMHPAAYTFVRPYVTENCHTPRPVIYVTLFHVTLFHDENGQVGVWR